MAQNLANGDPVKGAPGRLVQGATSGWSLKEIVVLTALGAAFAPLYIVWIQVWGVATGLFGPIGLDAIYGFWFIASPLCAYIFRKRGAALFGEWIAAVVQIPLGSPSGALLILSGLVQGLGGELPFALTRYRRFGTTTLMLSGMGAALASFIYTWLSFGYSQFAPGLLAVMLVVRLASGAVLAGLLGKAIGDGLAATGVLASFPLGLEWRARKAAAIHGATRDS